MPGTCSKNTKPLYHETDEMHMQEGGFKGRERAVPGFFIGYLNRHAC